MAEVFTPSWLCNAQINLIDDEWFGRKGTFNTETADSYGIRTWKTSRDKIMPVDCIVISGHTIFGYTHYEKVNAEELSKHIRSILAQNQYTELTVKVLNQYKPFLARIEGLNNIAAVEREDTKEKEEAIRGIILNISM